MYKSEVIRCWKRQSDVNATDPSGNTGAEGFGGLVVTTLPWWVSPSFIRPCLHV